MRCVRSDQSSATVTLHYLNNGGATLRFVLRKQEFLLPVILIAKALVNITDKELFDRLVRCILLTDWKDTQFSLFLLLKGRCEQHLLDSSIGSSTARFQVFQYLLEKTVSEIFG